MFLIFISDDAYTLKCSPEKVESYDIGNVGGFEEFACVQGNASVCE